MGITTGYFDSYFSSFSWSNAENLYDTNESSSAVAGQSGENNGNYGKTTNISEVPGATITQVRVAMKTTAIFSTDLEQVKIYTQGLGELLAHITNTHTSPAYGDWAILTVPSGGWSWDKVANLESNAFIDVKTWSEFYAIKIEVTYTGGVETKTSVGSANARINVITESDGTFNSRISVTTESVGSFNARIFVIEINETSVDVKLTTSSNQDIELETSTNQNPTLTTSTNKEIILN